MDEVANDSDSVTSSAMKAAAELIAFVSQAEQLKIKTIDEAARHIHALWSAGDSQGMTNYAHHIAGSIRKADAICKFDRSFVLMIDHLARGSPVAAPGEWPTSCCIAPWDIDYFIVRNMIVDYSTAAGARRTSPWTAARRELMNS